MKRILFFIIFFFIAFTFAHADDRFEVVITDTFRGVIFPENKASEVVSWIDYKRLWAPERLDILEAEKLSKLYLEQYKGVNVHHQECVPKILKQLNKYIRQYVGLVNKNGEKIIWINYSFADESRDFPNSYKKWISVVGGWFRYFSIKVNLSKKEVFDLRINSIR